jgi:hypothetical protein
MNPTNESDAPGHAKPAGLAGPSSDVEFLRGLLARAQRRVDPHAFHVVHWGAIVLVWYPLANWFQERGNGLAMNIVGGAALLLGAVLSTVLEARLKGRSRIEGEDHALGRHFGRVIGANVAAATVLSVVGPVSGFVPGPYVPVVWGLAYASMAFHTGLVYSRGFAWSGVAIFLGTCVAMFFPEQAGYVLGPVMGLGMIVPGVLAERRVRRLRMEDGARATDDAGPGDLADPDGPEVS